MKEFAGGVLIVILLLVAPWFFMGQDYALYRYFGPKQEAARRQIFEQSKAYNQGVVQELENMQFQYEQASPEHKAALKRIILHRAADYDDEKLPTNLKTFINDLRRSH